MVTSTQYNLNIAPMCFAAYRTGGNPDAPSSSKTNTVTHNKLDSTALIKPGPVTGATTGGTDHLEYEAKRRRRNDEEEMKMEASSKKRVAAEKTKFSNALASRGHQYAREIDGTEKMQQPSRDGKEYRNKKTEEIMSKEAKEHIKHT